MFLGGLLSQMLWRAARVYGEFVCSALGSRHTLPLGLGMRVRVSVRISGKDG